MAERTYGTTKWAEKAAYRRANKKALDRAFDIALRVMDLLDKKGWKAADLARAMEVTPQYISRIIKGQELNLGFEVLDKLAAALEGPIIEVVASPRPEAVPEVPSVGIQLGIVHSVFSETSVFSYGEISPPVLMQMLTEQREERNEAGRTGSSPFLMSPCYA